MPLPSSRSGSTGPPDQDNPWWRAETLSSGEVQLEILPRSYRRARRGPRLTALLLFAMAAVLMTSAPSDRGAGLCAGVFGLGLLVMAEFFMVGRPETWLLAPGRATRRILGRPGEKTFVPAALSLAPGGRRGTDRRRPILLLEASDRREIQVGPPDQRLKELMEIGRAMAKALAIDFQHSEFDRNR